MYTRTAMFQSSHSEWKAKVDKLAQDSGIDVNKAAVFLEKIIAKDLADERQFDYYYNPTKLLNFLIAEINGLISFYDTQLLINQSDVVRLFMFKLKIKLDEVTRNQEHEDDKKAQINYDLLCTQLTQFVSQLAKEDAFYPKLEKIHKHYGMDITKQTNLPSEEELSGLRKQKKMHMKLH